MHVNAYMHTDEMNTYSGKSIFGLKLLGVIDGVIDKCESGRLSSTKVAAEAECDNAGDL